MKRKILRAMILTILLVFSIVIVMEIAQGVFVRRNQEQYIEELEESSGIISREYTRLTDESLSNLAAKKAAEAEIVFRESSKMLTTLRNQLLFVLSEDDKTVENNFSLPRKDAGEGEISSYYGLPDDVDAKDEKVKSDIAVLSRIAPTIEASIEPGSAIYGAGVLTMSGPVMLTNTNEAMAASEMPYLNEWSGVIRESLPSAADKINYYVQVPDIVTSENCCMVVLPVFYNEEAWGALFYLIQESYFTNLVEENYLDEQDICFITPRKRINAIITSEKDGPFRLLAGDPDLEQYMLEVTEKDVSEKLLKAFEDADRGHITAKLNTPIAGSDDITFYYSPIEAAGWMMVIGRPETLTAKYSQVVSNTLVDIVSDSNKVAREYLFITIAIFLTAIAAAAIISAYLARKYAETLTTPIRTLTKKVEALGGESLDFTWESMGGKQDETEILADAFGVMTERIKRDIKRITQMLTERERIEAELSFAANIQKSMLPDIDDSFLHGERFSLYASMRPAKSVGGDFYDFFMLDEDRLAFLIADVSDKGTGAALFMAVSKTVIGTRIRAGGTPAEVLRDANAILSEKNKECMFVTVFLAVLNLRTGEVTACNAGHDYPFVYIRNGNDKASYQLLKEAHGSPLAFFSGSKKRGKELPGLSWQLSPGDRIFLYTDGVNEAQGSDGIEFGLDRIRAVLDSHIGDDDKKLCESMQNEIDTFLKGEPQFDDITMVSVTYKG